MVQFAFFPARKTVDVGDTVTFAMPKRTIEIHNVAFGPKPYLDEHAKTFLGPTLNPFVVYRSDAPGTAVQFDGSDHGNGYFNTGRPRQRASTAVPVEGLRHVHEGRHRTRTTAPCTATTCRARSSFADAAPSPQPAPPAGSPRRGRRS